MPFDYKKEYKEFYLPPQKPQLLEVPPMNYVAVRGHGDPNAQDGEYEAKKEQTIEKAETLLEEENLKKYIGDFDFVPESELEISENGNLWHIQNGYRYQELSARIIDFREDMPYITKATQYFSIGDGWMIWMSLSVDENFDITESKFYILAPEEVEAMYGSGLSIDGSRWMEYMDRETMDRILKERE